MELTIDQALQQGVAAHREGKIQEADRLYTAILSAQPNHPDANHNMGLLAVAVGKPEVALPFFKTALDINSNVEQFWLSYIDALIKAGNIGDAKSALTQARAAGFNSSKVDQLGTFLDTENISKPKLEDSINVLIDMYNERRFSEALEKGK